jgi:DNA modification methylase
VKNVETIIRHGNSLDVLKEVKSSSIDLIVTSPPYADSRTTTYGGIKPDAYVDWFLPISDELKRVLKEDGTFILNIKERVVAGERHTYVIELILAMRKAGWLWTEEFIWHKKIRIRESGRTDFATRGSASCNSTSRGSLRCTKKCDGARGGVGKVAFEKFECDGSGA